MGRSTSTRRRWLGLIVVVLLVPGVLLGCEKPKPQTPPRARARAEPRPAARAAVATARPRPVAARPRPRETGVTIVTTRPPPRREPPRVALPVPVRFRPRPPPPPRRIAPIKTMPVAQIQKLVQDGQLDRGLEEAKKVLEVNERSVPALAIMAKVYFTKGEYELCRAVLGLINNVQRNHPEWLYLWGRLYLREKNYSLAQKYFERAVKANDGLLDAHTIIGVRSLQSGAYQKALTHLLKARSLPGGNTYRLNLNIGTAYRGLATAAGAGSNYYRVALNYYDEAIKRYRRVPGNQGKNYLKAIYNKAILFLDAKGFPDYSKVRRLQTGMQLLENYVALVKVAEPHTWAAEKKRVELLLGRVKNNDLPAAKAEEAAAKAGAGAGGAKPGGDPGGSK